MDSRLKALAYSMLGSVEDAEEIVQEAQLRLYLADPKPNNENGFLFRIVSNLSIDRLRRKRVERRAYSGPWLPEPWQVDQSSQVELTQELTIGFLHLLEVLTPAERISYVLREAFDYSHGEIAEVLGVTPSAARQRNRRARVKLTEKSPTQKFPDAVCRSLLEQLVDCVVQDDVGRLVSLLADDVVAYTDGGGVVSAAIVPITNKSRVAQVALHLAKRGLAQADLELSYERVNGSWALLMRQAGAIHSLSFIEGREELITRIYVVRNPAKLQRIL